MLAPNGNTTAVVSSKEAAVQAVTRLIMQFWQSDTQMAPGLSKTVGEHLGEKTDTLE